MYKLKETEEFSRQFRKLPKKIRREFQKKFVIIKENPYSIGKPISYKWFRELKNNKFRVYYFIYDKEIIVLFVGVSEKKNQQQVIDFVKKNKDILKDNL